LSQNEIEITLLTRPQFAPIFSSIPRLKVQAVDLKNNYKGPLGLWRLAREIKALNPDCFLDLHDVLRTKILRRYLRFLGVSSSTFDKGRAEKKQRVAHFDSSLPWLKSTHQRYAEGLAALGLKVRLDLGEKAIDLDKSALQKRSPLVQDFLNSLKDQSTLNTQSGACIGFAPFAAFAGKTYPLDLAKTLCQALIQKGHQVLLFGAPGQEAAQLTALAKDQKGIHVLAGNGHLAANFGLPVLTLWGATHPSLGFMPFGQGLKRQLFADRRQYPKIPTSVYGNKLPKGYAPLMRSIPVEDIVQKVEDLLG
jgi:ADP-heptose:LPS heptosyltransferase